MIELEDELTISLNSAKPKQPKQPKQPKHKPLKTSPMKVPSDKKKQYFNELQTIINNITAEHEDQQLVFVDVYGGDAIIDHWIKHEFNKNAKVFYNDVNNLYNKIKCMCVGKYKDYLQDIECIHNLEFDVDDDDFVIYIVDPYGAFDTEVFSKYLNDQDKHIILFDNAKVNYIKTYNACTNAQLSHSVYHDSTKMIYTRI